MLTTVQEERKKTLYIIDGSDHIKPERQQKRELKGKKTNKT